MVAQIDEIDTTGVVATPNNQIIDDGATTKGTVTAFEAGVYFSVAHTFQYSISAPQTYNGDIYFAESATLNSMGATASFVYPGAYVAQPYFNPDINDYDHSLVSSAKSNSAPQNSIAVFADTDALKSFFSSAYTTITDGITSHEQTGSPQGVTSGYQFAMSNPVQAGDSGGAVSAIKDGKSYVIGVINADQRDPTDGHSIGGYGTAISLSEYYSAFAETGLKNNTTSVTVFAKDNGDYIDGTGGNVSVVDSGSYAVITAGSNDIINAESGKDDVVFLPGALGPTDSGTTVVVSPGITTLVGGGTNDKLVLLADRLDDTNNVQGSDALSDSSSTMQLLGGWDPLGQGVDGIYSTNSPSGNATLFENYYLHGGDLYITYDDESQGNVDWDGEVIVKNFQPGDFGINLITGDERAAMAQLTAAPQSVDSVDDDPGVTWSGRLPLATPDGSPVTQFAPVSDATIAADLKLVMNDDGGASPDPDSSTPVAPSIANASPNQVTTGEAPLSPFGGVTLTDGNTGANDTLTIMQLGGGGTLEGNGLVSNPNGTYTLAAADPSILTAELQALVFTPMATAGGEQSTTVFTLVDQSSADETLTDISTSVTDTPGGTPTSSIAISGARSNQTAYGENPVPLFSGMSVTDRNEGASDTVTITLLGGGGTLSGAGVIANLDGSYTIDAIDPSMITADLQAITFTATAGTASETTTFSVADQNSAGATASDGSTTVTVAADGTVAAAPTIAGTQAGQATQAGAPLYPFAGVTITDGNTGASDTLTISFSGTGGFLSGNGLTANPDGTYTLAAADPATIAWELDALTFTPSAGALGTQSTTDFTLTDQSSAGVNATDSSTSVIDTVAMVVTIAGTQADLTTTAEAAVQPFSSVTVADGNSGAVDTLTVALSGGGGTLTGDGLTANPDGTYTLAASDPATVTAELDALSFTPSAPPPGGQSTTTFTLTDQSNAGVSTTDATTTVTDISGLPPPVPVVITGPQAAQTTTAEAPVQPFSSVTVADGNSGAVDTLTVALSGGGGTLTGDGLTANPDGTYTLAASDPATVTAELDALSFTPSAPPPGGQSTTTFTLTDQSNAGVSTTDATTTVTDISGLPPPAPVAITGPQAAQTTTAEAPVQPFADVTVADGNSGATDTVMVAFFGEGGTLTGPGLTNTFGNYYRLAASDPTTITAELDAITFVPTAGLVGYPAQTNFFILDQSSAGPGGFFSTSVVDTAIEATGTAPTISGTSVGQATSDESSLAPFANVTITDGNAGATDTVAITLSGGGGILSGAGLTANSDGSYTLGAADPATITAELQALTFTPTASAPGTMSTTTLSLLDQSSAGTSASDINTTVVDTAANTTTTSAGNLDATLQAPDGDVTLVAGTGNDTFNGGNGDDTFIYAQADGNLTINDHNYSFENPRNNTLKLSDLSAGDVTLSRDTANDLLVTVNATGKVITAGGTFNSDAHDGVQNVAFADGTVLDHDQLVAAAPLRAGNLDATLQAPDGDVTLVAGTGNDTFNGGNGDDTFIYAQADGNLTINDHNYSFETPRNNTLKLSDLSAGDVTLSRDTANDLLVTVNATGKVINAGGTFNSDAHDGMQNVAFADGTVLDHDQLVAAAPLRAGNLDATLQAPDGDVTLVAGTGNDTFNGGNGNDTFVYAQADGNLAINDHNYSFENPRNNTLKLSDLSAGDVTLSRDTANDLLVTVNDTGKVINAGGTFNSDAHDGVQNVAFADGTVLDHDQLVAAAPLRAGNLDATLQAPDGDVTLVAGTGNDTFNGGNGDDTFIYAQADGNLTINDHNYSFENPRNNTLKLSDLSAGDVTLSRDTANDLLVTVNATGKVITAGGTFNSDAHDGVQNVAFADGTVLDHDQLVAAAPLRAGNLDATLQAPDGDVTLVAGTGNDTFNGGNGDDTFIYAQADGNLTINDHNYSFENPRNNTLKLSDLSAGDVTLSRDTANDLLVTVNATGKVITAGGTFNSDAHDGVQNVAFADGTVLDHDQLVAAAPLRAGNLDATLQAPDGDVTLVAGTGNDTFNGGNGDDTFIYAQADGNLTINDHNYSFENPRNNTLKLSDLSVGDVTLSRDTANDLIVTVNATGKVITAGGTFNSDAHDGVQNVAFADGTVLDHDQLVAAAPLRAGNLDATLQAPDGDVTLVAGTGNDTFNGGNGDDTFIYAQADGNLTINDHNYSFENPRNNTLKLSDVSVGDVTLSRDTANDLLVTVNATGKVINAGSTFNSDAHDGVQNVAFADGTVLDHDQLVAAAPLRAGNLDATLQAPDGDVTLVAGTGNDTFNGGNGDDTFIYAQADGNLTINDHNYSFENPRNNTLKLSDLSVGDVTLSRDTANDLLVTVNATGKVITAGGTFNSDAHDGVQNVAFADGTVLDHDQLVAAAPLRAGNLDATLQAPDGDVTLVAGTGNDTFNGGNGDDTFVYAQADGNLTINDHNYSFENPRNNTLKLSDLSVGDVTLSRDTANDLLVTVNATGKVITAGGTFNSDAHDGVQNVAFADGTVLDHDQLVAAAPLRDGNLDATLQAPDGDVTLVAGTGNDTFNGGNGNDTFVYAQADGNLTINDIYQSGWSNQSGVLRFGDLNAGGLTLTQQNSDLLISIAGTGKTIDVAGQFDAGGQDGVGKVQFAGGPIWSRADINQHLTS